MLCGKCHQNEARITIHLTAVADGTEDETVHLCHACAPPMGFDLGNPDLKQIEALSVIGKECEFCGRDALSGEMDGSGGAIYWCFDCGLERGVILRDLLIAEKPDLLQRTNEERSFLALCADPALQAWLVSASERATQILKKRRRQDGHDKGS